MKCFFMVMEKKSKPKLGQAGNKRNIKFHMYLIAAETQLIKSKLYFQREWERSFVHLQSISCHG